MNRQSFLKGAFILVLASISVKALGFIYQVLVIRMIGTEGIGVFNMIYPLYSTILILATSGIPTALTKYVAEENARNNIQNINRFMAMAISIVLFSSTLCSLLLIIVSPHLIRRLYTDPRVIPAFLIMVPTLLMVAVSSCIRGYFQGLQDMRPTAINQIIEQIIRFCSGLLIIYLLSPYGLTWATVGMASAILLSEAGGLLYIWRLYTNKSRRTHLLLRPTQCAVKKLFTFGIPLTLTRVIGTVVSAAEASLIPHLLMKSGATIPEATSIFGELTGVAFSLLGIPSTLTFSLATTLVPAIAEAQGKGQKKILAERTGAAIAITLLAGVPCAIILYLWGQELTALVFKVRDAGYILQYFALGSIFLYLSQTTSGILQGTGYVKSVFVTSIISNTIKLGGIIILGSRPGAGLQGIILSYLAGFVSMALLNLAIIKGKTGFKLEPALYLRLILGSFLLIQLLHFTKGFIRGQIANLAVLILINVLFFFTFLFISGDKYTRLIIQQIKKN